MELRLRTTTRLGPLALDASSDTPKEKRVQYTLAAAVCIGEAEPGTGALESVKLAVPDNALFLRHAGDGPRGAWGSYGWAFPMVTETNAQAIRPLLGWDAADEDFEVLRDARVANADAPDGEGFQPAQKYRTVVEWYGRGDAELPVGARSILVQGTGHGVNEPMAFPAGGPLIAARQNPRTSRHVFDESGNHGPLHALTRVTEIPIDENATVVGERTTHVPALQLGRSEAEPEVGFGPFYCPSPGPNGAPLAGFLSALIGGLVHPGFPGDRHQIAVSPGKLEWNPAHLNLAAPWAVDPERDGPPAVSSVIVSNRGDLGAPYPDMTFYETYLGWDFSAKVFRWMTPSLWADAIGPYPDPEELVQRITQVNNNVNVNVVVNLPPVVVNVVIINNPPPNAPLNPGGNGDKIDPARCPREIAVPSIFGTPVRRAGKQPYDGRFGWRPRDPDTGDEALNPDEFVGVPTGEVDNLGFPISPETRGFVEAPTTGEDGSAIPVDPETGTPAAGSLGKQSEIVGQVIDDQPRDEHPDWQRKPLCCHIQFFGAFGDDGEWATTTAEGDYFARGGSMSGGAMVGPAEILLDAEAPQLVSDSAFIVYNGIFGGAQLGNPTKLGSATPNQATGAIEDGWYDVADGPSDAVDSIRKYVDASGVQRLGRHTLQGELLVDIGGGGGTGRGLLIDDSGNSSFVRLSTVAAGGFFAFSDHIVPDLDGTFVCGSSTLAWRDVHSDQFQANDDGSASAPAFVYNNDPDTGQYRVGADQIGWSCGGTARLGLTTSALKPLGNATDLGAASDRFGDGWVNGLDVDGDLCVDQRKSAITATDLSTSTTHTIADTDNLVQVGGSSDGGSPQFNLPASPSTEREFIVKNTGGDTLALSGNGNNIDGAASVNLTQYQFRHVIFDGSVWHVIGKE